MTGPHNPGSAPGRGVWMPRVIVSPNSFSRRDPHLSVASFNDMEHGAFPGEAVIAIQPDDDGMEGQAPATVVDVDFERRLVYLKVEWDKFQEVPSAGHEAHYLPRTRSTYNAIVIAAQIDLEETFDQPRSQTSGSMIVGRLEDWVDVPG